MNHWQHVELFRGAILVIWGGRRVRITGASVPGSANCEPVDGGVGPYEVSTIFLTDDNRVAK